MLQMPLMPFHFALFNFIDTSGAHSQARYRAYYQQAIIDRRHARFNVAASMSKCILVIRHCLMISHYHDSTPVYTSATSLTAFSADRAWQAGALLSPPHFRHCFSHRSAARPRPTERGAPHIRRYRVARITPPPRPPTSALGLLIVCLASRVSAQPPQSVIRLRCGAREVIYATHQLSEPDESMVGIIARDAIIRGC